ncbi:MAG: hypothetical protein N3G21_08930 [Candidatus Hydrogenedentes bacterium]|nr:hypothetical protein [Candidatus Hydrogenedentota bacterium]
MIPRLIKVINERNSSANEDNYKHLIIFLIIAITCILIFKKLIDIYFNYDIYQNEIPALSVPLYLRHLSHYLLNLILPTNYFPIKGLGTHTYYSIIVLFLTGVLVTFSGYFVKKNFYSSGIISLLGISIGLSPIFASIDILSCTTLYYLFTFFILTLGIITQDLMSSSKTIRYCVLIFLIIIGAGTTLLSFPLLKEVKNPEILWFSSASNNPSNPEPWRYLGRLFLERAENTPDKVEQERLYEASLQCWNEILSLHPEDTEALVNSAKCKLHLNPLESEKTLDRALSLDPTNKDAVREKLNIYLSASEKYIDDNKLQRIFYNTYLTYFILNKLPNNEDIDNVCRLALNHQDELFLEKFLSQLDINIPNSEYCNKLTENCKNTKPLIEKLKLPTLNEGEKFLPPANIFSEIYKHRNIDPLIISWSAYQYKLNPSDKKPLLNIGLTYAQANRFGKFIEIWKHPLENNNEFWENLCELLISESLFEYSQEAITQTTYSEIQKKFKLIEYALNKGKSEFAKKTLEELKNYQLSLDEEKILESYESRLYMEDK